MNGSNGATVTRRVGYSLAVVAFLLPFLTVSCMNREVTSPSGLQLAIGADAEINEEFADEVGESGIDQTTPQANAIASGDNSPNAWLLIAGLATLTAAVIAFADRTRTVHRGVSIGLALVALVGIAVFWSDVQSEARELETLGFEVAPGIGLWIAIAGVLAGGVGDLMQGTPAPQHRSPSRKSTPTPSPATEPVQPEQREHRTEEVSRSPPTAFCVKCGHRHRDEDRYCGHCGTERVG